MLSLSSAEMLAVSIIGYQMDDWATLQRLEALRHTCVCVNELGMGNYLWVRPPHQLLFFMVSALLILLLHGIQRVGVARELFIVILFVMVCVQSYQLIYFIIIIIISFHNFFLNLLLL